jgi:hypothetical protein
MREDRRRSPGQWAPWIDDPDPPEEPMTQEAMDRAAEATKRRMADPNRQEPVDPLDQPPEETPEQTREVIIADLMRRKQLTREQAERDLEGFL